MDRIRYSTHLFSIYFLYLSMYYYILCVMVYICTIFFFYINILL